MNHRNMIGHDWNRMAIDSLYSRGELADWREFVQAMKRDPEIAKSALAMAEGHEDGGSAALARMLVARHHPELNK